MKPGEPTAMPGFQGALGFGALAVASFHLAFSFPALSCLVPGYLIGLLQLARLRTSRLSFYSGLLVGMCVYSPHLAFFWRLFGPAAIPLWAVLSFWLAVFVLTAHQVYVRFGRLAAFGLAPFLWTGLEYFRGELYLLKFSWLSVGYAFSESLPWAPMNWLGLYGIGFLFALAAGALVFLRRPGSWIVGGTIFALAILSTNITRSGDTGRGEPMHVAGVQLEFPSTHEAATALDRVLEQHPETDLFVLSEYTFAGELPPEMNDWCRQNGKHLAVGAKDRLRDDLDVSGNNFRNTVFVVGTNGSVVFRQVKSVPIQFFQDGLPAEKQSLWESPWGRLGFCVCYDLSYSRVIDGLVRQGAQAIIVPTMDVSDWGEHEHRLHARVAPVRAAEYGIPIFRVCSSGISQWVDRRGSVRSSAPFPGQGETITAQLRLGPSGSLPLDRYLAPIACGATAITMLLCALHAASTRRGRTGKSTAAMPKDLPELVQDSTEAESLSGKANQ